MLAKILSIVERAMIIIALVIFSIYLLIGILKGWKKTCVRLAFLGATVLITMLFTVLTVKAFEPTLETIVLNTLNQNVTADVAGQINDAVSVSPTLYHYVYSLVLSLVSPIVFVILFLVLSLIMKIPAVFMNKLVLKVTEGKLDKPLFNRLMGGVLGLVCAFSVTACLFMPITGYIGVGFEIFDTLQEEQIIKINESDQEIVDEIDKFANSKFVKYQSFASKPLFSGVSKVRTNYESKTINEEVDTIIAIYKDVMVVVKNDYSDITKINLDDIKTLVDTATEREVYKQIFAEVLSNASTKWANNEAVFGFNVKQSIDADLHSTLDILLEDFKNTDKDTVKADIYELATTFEVFVDVVVSLQGMQFNDVTNIDTTQFNETIDIVETSEKVQKIVAELLLAGATKWDNNEPFLGLNILENVPEDFHGALKAVFSELKSTSSETVCNDLRAFTNAVDVLTDLSGSVESIDFADYKTFNTANLDELIQKIDSDNLVKKVVAALLKDAGNAWGDDPAREFLGINVKESLPEGFENALDKNLEDFKTTNERTVINDLQRFSDTVKAYKYAISLTDPEASMDDLEENVNNFVNSINQNNVDILKDTITDEMLSISGIETENSPILGDILSTTIQNISTLPDGQKDAEADALNNLLAYAKEHQTREGGTVSSSVTEEELVDSIVVSSALSDAVKSYSEYSTATIKTSEEEKSSIESALSKYQGTTDENVSSTVSAIEKLFGLGG